MPEYVQLMQVAKRIGVDPTTVRRLIQRVGEDLGIEVEQRRGNTSNAKWTYCVSPENADKLVAYYESQRGGPLSEQDDVLEGEFQRFGFFYIIQLVPEALPNRVKIGYTDNLEKRLAELFASKETRTLVGDLLALSRNAADQSPDKPTGSDAGG